MWMLCEATRLEFGCRMTGRVSIEWAIAVGIGFPLLLLVSNELLARSRALAGLAQLDLTVTEGNHAAQALYAGCGFTVFGRVTGPGMATMTRIADLPVLACSSPFGSLPVRTRPSSCSAADATHLVLIERTRILPEPQRVNNALVFNVVVRLTGQDLKKLIGMQADLSFTTEKLTGVVLVKNEALVSEGRDCFVFVPVRQSARGRWDEKKIPVKIGATDGTFTEVISGLKEGEEVVVGKHEDEAAAASTNTNRGNQGFPGGGFPGGGFPGGGFPGGGGGNRGGGR